MLTLAFESSARPASVALMEDDVLVSQYTQCSALTHSRTLLPMAEDLLKNAEISIKDIDRLAVAQGPGSFTLKSSHPPLLPHSPNICSLHMCLFCCLVYRIIITVFLNSIYMH